LPEKSVHSDLHIKLRYYGEDEGYEIKVGDDFEETATLSGRHDPALHQAQQSEAPAQKQPSLDVAKLTSDFNVRSLIESGDLKIEGDKSFLISQDLYNDRSRLKSFLESLQDLKQVASPGKQPYRNKHEEVNNAGPGAGKSAQRRGAPMDGDLNNLESFGAGQRQPGDMHDFDGETMDAQPRSSLQQEEGSNKKPDQFRSLRSLRTKSESLKQQNLHKARPAATTSDFEVLNQPWVFRVREGEKYHGLAGFEVHDSISCIALETAFQKYIESNGSDAYRFCHFRAGSTVDFQKFVEIKSSKENEGEHIKRTIEV